MLWFTKQRKKKARNTLLCLLGENFGFSDQIQGQFRPFLASFSRIGHFGRWPIRLDMANMARFWPNQLGSARIKVNSARIEPSRSEFEKKKFRRGIDARATASDAASRVGLGCGTLPAAFVLSSSWTTKCLTNFFYEGNFTWVCV